jgi:uncharacterized protein YdaU (DUF1376 family)
MAKDPAFLFYSADFTVGTQFFTAEQVGIYIRLLCAQHQHGRLYEHHMKIICGSYDFHSDILRVVKEKFIVDEQGRFFNERLEVETQKRAAYSKSRGENRSKGLLKKQLENNHMNIISSSYDNHMENENENINTDDIVIKKTKKDKPKKEQTYSLIFPVPEMEAIWVSWAMYKKSQHGFTYKAVDSAQIAINNLWALSGNNASMAQEIANYSIGNGYKGFFKPNNNFNGNQAITTSSGRSGSRNAGNEQLAAMLQASLNGQANSGGSTSDQYEIFTTPL